MQLRSMTRASVLASLVLAIAASQAQAVMAGSNMYVDYNGEVDVPYSGFAGQYYLNTILIHSPWYGPFFKNFESPISDTLDPILLDAEYPWPIIVNESYYLPPILSPILTLPVAGWYEQIVTDGWEWVIPGDPRFPNCFPEDQTLITKNGEPHPSVVVPSILAVYEPEKLRIEFPPIREGETLDIHKALMWVGTPGNRIWGDHQTDDGTYFSESFIRVFEYPYDKHVNGLPGDLDSDGFVGFGDLDIILSNWNLAVPTAHHLADVAGPDGHYPDGYVGINDLDVVLANWNIGTRPTEHTAAIPEPASATLVLLSVFGLSRARR